LGKAAWRQGQQVEAALPTQSRHWVLKLVHWLAQPAMTDAH
jgi:hypothetical protein